MTISQIFLICAPYLFLFFMASILFVFAVPLSTAEWLSRGLHKKNAQNRTRSKTVL